MSVGLANGWTHSASVFAHSVGMPLAMAPKNRLLLVRWLPPNGIGTGLRDGILRYVVQRGGWRVHLNANQLSITRYPWDAAIVFLAAERHRDDVLTADKPVLNVSNRLPDGLLPKVRCNDAAVGQMAADHLLELGYRPMGFVGVPQAHFSEQRYLGFSERVAAAGGRCAVFRAQDHRRPRWRARAAALPDWLGKLPRPAGVFCTSDSAALSAWHACKHAGLRVPHDIALLGVDNDPTHCQLADPPLSSIALPFERMGYEAAGLINQMADGKSVPMVSVSEPTLLIARGSTRAGGAEDPVVREAMSFIQQHAGEPVHVESILDALPVSRRALETRFQAVLGITPGQAIRSARLQLALQLLATTQLSITAVAEQSGCSNLARLNELFRRELGVCPSDFRRRTQSGLATVLPQPVAAQAPTMADGAGMHGDGLL